MRYRAIRNQTAYFFIAVFAILIGLYPFQFITLSTKAGLLSGKPDTLVESSTYLILFFTHIFAGGIALLSGFTQFFPGLRRKRTRLHRGLGRVYVLAVLASGSAGLGIAVHATGGWIAGMGFACLAIAWLYSTLKAFNHIRNGKVMLHRQWMIRSYALCFAAVTLRIYLPLATVAMGIEFITAYRTIAWLCWIPNLLVAEFLIKKGLAVPQEDTSPA